MKKFVVTILALVYLSTSIGVTMHMRYCMGAIASWGLGNRESKTCNKCGMEIAKQKDTGCCTDKHTFLKSNTDQKTTESSLQAIQLIAVALPASFIEIPSNGFPSIAERNPNRHAPPLDHGIPIYILNCIYRI